MRKYVLFAVIFFTVSLAGAGLAVVEQTADVTGTWEITIDFGTNTSIHTAVIEQDGDRLSGTYKGQFLEGNLRGVVEGMNVEITTSLRNESKGFRLHFVGTVEGDTITYRDDYVYDEVNVDWADYWRGDFTAKRVKK